MLKYTIRRLLLIVPTLFFVLLITFTLAHVAPGGPWDADENKLRSPLIIENLNRKYGLDKSLQEQFATYLWNLVRGDLGVSFSYRDRQVTEIIAQFFPVSAQLGIQAVLLAVAIAIPLGVVSALKQNTIVDYGALLLVTVGVAIPSFVIAIFLIYLFGVQWHLLPVLGWGKLQNMVLPTAILAIGASAFLTRITRASMLEAIRQDYVRTARAKGLSEQVVIVGHVLRNALIPVATILGPATAAVITGTFFIEYMFSIPGLGREFVRSINARDYPMIMAVFLLFAFVISLANLTVDLIYGALDPRVKVGR